MSILSGGTDSPGWERLTMTKYLIINADDFGLSPSVNRGILKAFHTGTITSTTLMTNMPGFQEAIEIAKAKRDLGVGLHFNLSYGRPLSPPSSVPSLVGSDGTYAYRPGESAVTWTAEDVKTELEAQWNRFLATGLHPTHIDSHHGIHSFEPALSLVTELCLKYDIPFRRPLHFSSTIGQRPMTTDELIFDEYFHGDGHQRFYKHLSELKEGVTEFICHPGYVDDLVRSVSPWTDVREVELSVFTDAKMAEAIRYSGVVQTHFGKLKKHL